MKTVSETIKINFVPFDTRKNLLQITQNKGVFPLLYNISRKCRSTGYRDARTMRFSAYQNIDLLTIGHREHR